MAPPGINSMTDSFADDFDPPYAADPLHSRLGVASFVLGMVGNCLIWGAGLAIAAFGLAIGEGADESDMEPAFVAGGLVAILGFVCNLVGVPLGIAALFQKERRLLYAIIGLGVCALTAIVWPIMAVLVTAMSASAQ
jgi:hypothetical protein